MDVLAIGDPWTPEDVRRLGGARWVPAGALAQSDFPAETMAELAKETESKLSELATTIDMHDRGVENGSSVFGGFAQSFARIHGPSVCAIARTVPYAAIS